MASETVTLVTSYEDRKQADQAIEALRQEGFRDQAIKILQGKGNALVGELKRHGFGEADAREFAQEADDGKTLVAAQIPDGNTDRALSILQRFEASEEEGVKRRVREQTVPVTEEELSVEKHKVVTGGVRVTSEVTEQPVKEKVTLREEHVEAERRPADRPLKGDEAEEAFEEKTVEMMGSKEEAEVRKEARVTGEIALTRETTERQATVSDTVRSTEVEVEEIKAGARKRK
jgi:uncharacterized protein (TIGR02271 family)